MTEAAIGLLLLYVASSMVYVYAYRGQTRYSRVREYLRKSWPIFTPLNCFLYLSTHKRGRRSIMNLAEFPELAHIQAHWQEIRDEARALMEKGFFDATTRRDSAAYYDIGFRTFYKYGWSKFYLKWYGYTHNSAMTHCPKTTQVLSQVPNVNGAMLTLLPPGSKLTRHSDPIGCSFRYHLGLLTPNSEHCFINIDGQQYAWMDGDALLFDETYLHFVNNNTDQPRLILMCDVERPMHWPGRAFNWLYKKLVILTIVPNTDQDRRGFFNRLFLRLMPVMEWGQQLRKTNKRLYKTLEYTLNAALLLIVVAVLALPWLLLES